LKATDPRDKNKTKQDYGTDPKLFEKLNKRFEFTWDLACDESNCLVRNANGTALGYTYPLCDALLGGWHEIDGWLFLNPPFSNIEPWAKLCHEESLRGAKIVLLTPASVGSNWYRDHVHNKAEVIFLNGRLTFKGTKPNPKTGKIDAYPKDCQISVFNRSAYSGFKVWDWKKD